MSESFRGKIGALSSDEVEAFLASPALARFACLKPDGAPYVIPLWYQWDGEACGSWAGRGQDGATLSSTIRGCAW